MNVVRRDYVHMGRSYFHERFQFLAATGLPRELQHCVFRMQVRETHGSAVLLELSTWNGGITHYGGDSFVGVRSGVSSGEMWKVFTKKGWEQEVGTGRWVVDYFYRVKLPGVVPEVEVLAPDGAIELFFDMLQSHEAFRGRKSVLYDIEMVPMMREEEGVMCVMRDVDFVTLSNDGVVDGNGDRSGVMTLPYGAGTFHDFRVGGEVQLWGPDVAAMEGGSEVRRLSVGNTMWRRIVGVGIKRLELGQGWCPGEVVKCNVNYRGPAVQSVGSVGGNQAARGRERMANVEFWANAVDDWVLGSGWVWNEEDGVVVHSVGQTAVLQYRRSLLGAEDMGNRFEMQMCVSRKPVGSLSPGEMPVGVLTVELVGLGTWELGVDGWQSQTVRMVFDCEGVVPRDVVLRLIPAVNFEGGVSCVSLREVADHGFLGITNDTGSGTCRLVSSTGNFRMGCKVKGKEEALFSARDSVLISNSIVASADVEVSGWDGFYRVESVSEKEMVVSPVPKAGVDGVGVFGLVITRADSGLGERVAHGEIKLVPPVTEGSVVWG